MENVNSLTFENINVSTQTFTVKTNICNIDLAKVYIIFPIDSCITFVKNVKTDSENNRFEQCKGINPKIKQTNDLVRKNFLNCVTLILKFDKKINVKIFKNGVFQLTGCKHVDHVKRSLEKIFSILRLRKDCFSFLDNDNDFIVYIKSAMRNINFSLDYKINCNTLLECLQNSPVNIIPPNPRNVGIKFKIKVENIEETTVLCVEYKDRKETIYPFKTCFEKIEPDETKLKKKLAKERFSSISIFHNGKILMSSMEDMIQKKCFEWLMSFLSQHRSYIEKKQVQPKTLFS